LGKYPKINNLLFSVSSSTWPPHSIRKQTNQKARFVVIPSIESDTADYVCIHTEIVVPLCRQTTVGNVSACEKILWSKGKSVLSIASRIRKKSVKNAVVPSPRAGTSSMSAQDIQRTRLGRTVLGRRCLQNESSFEMMGSGGKSRPCWNMQTSEGIHAKL
jgi:hypothetical protein